MQIVRALEEDSVGIRFPVCRLVLASVKAPGLGRPNLDFVGGPVRPKIGSELQPELVLPNLNA